MKDSSSSTEDPSGTENKPTNPARPAKATKAALSKVLPTDRVSFEKQASALRAYAAASGRDKKPVNNEEVAAVMSDLAPSSISLCNVFFTDAGLLVQEGRKLRPVDAVFDAHHAYEWTPDTAGLKLQHVFSDHWASKTLVPKLAFRQLSKDEAITFLAEESKATTGHRKNLETLLDFLNYAGVVRVEGNTVMKAAGGAAVDPPPPTPPPPASVPPPPKDALGAGYDPMIVGLFKKLPPADTDWSASDRVKWLRTAANIFGLVYPDQGAEEIEIDIKKEVASKGAAE